MSPEGILYRRVLQDRQDLYERALQDGIYSPFIYPWDTLPILFLAIGVILTPRLPPTIARVSRYGLTLSTTLYACLRWPYVRGAIWFASGYGIGLAGFWGLIMTLILLVLHDPGKDFRRIEIRHHARQDAHKSISENGATTTLATPTSAHRRTATNHSGVNDDVQSSSQGGKESTYVWQAQPEELWHLLDWSVDLMTTFRFINWNFRIPIHTYEALPPEGESLNVPTIKGNKRTPLQQLRRSALLNFMYYYIVIDLLKTVMMTDPYWLGIASLDSASPWPWLMHANEIVPGATKLVRLMISCVAVVAALTFIFSLNPVFFATILPKILGEKLYSVTKSPLLEVWMYPPQWGNMFDTLCDKGLAGMWSRWWHQMFRFGISEPARLLTESLQIDPRGQVARCLQLIVAFGLTASIHAAASSTTFSIVPSQPWQPFIFFSSQAFGILFQTATAEWLNRKWRFSRAVRRAGNFAFVFLFQWFVGPYLSDDFARSGIWLFEPVPISIFRGLGFGPADAWVPWLHNPYGMRWFGWWYGSAWYNSGIAIY